MMHALALALPGALAGLAVTFFVMAALPSRPALGAALDRLGSTEGAPSRARTLKWDARLGLWVHAHLPDLPVFATPSRDLNIVGMQQADFYRDKALLLLAGLVFPSVVGLVGGWLGFVPMAMPIVLSIPIAVALWFVPDRSLRAKAQRARADFARTVAVYLELVASERKRGAPASRALFTASDVGTNWVFQRIREELTRARLAGTTPWTALSGLATEIDVPELADVAKIVRLSGEEGASVAESLRSRGRTLRTQLLADEHASANQASERMSIPLTFLAFIFIGIVLTPLVLNLLA